MAFYGPIIVIVAFVILPLCTLTTDLASVSVEEVVRTSDATHPFLFPIGSATPEVHTSFAQGREDGCYVKLGMTGDFLILHGPFERGTTDRSTVLVPLDGVRAIRAASCSTADS
jgi:hypothetical protein